MKNAKIFAISSVLAILLTACGSPENPTNGHKEPGFTYEHPSDTFVEPDNTKIDFKGNDLIKNVLVTFPSETASEERKKEWLNEVLEVMDKNQIVPSNVSYDLVDYQKRNYGELDTRNKDISCHYEVKRNNETYEKAGTFAYKAQTYSKQPEDPNVADSPKVVKADDPIDYKGNISYICDVENKTYTDKVEFTNVTKDAIVDNGTLNWTNLNKAMILSDLTVFKGGFKNLISYAEGTDQASDKFTFDSAFVVEKVGEDFKISVSTLLTNKPVAEKPEAPLMRNDKQFSVIFAKDGYVKEAYRLNEDTWINAGAGDVKSVEKFEEKYTFSL